MKEEYIGFIEENGGKFEFEKNTGNIVIFNDSDVQNKFGYIKVNNETICGISYCDYGVFPQAILDKSGKLWIGFGEKLVVIEKETKFIVLEKKLSSVFFEIIS